MWRNQKFNLPKHSAWKAYAIMEGEDFCLDPRPARRKPKKKQEEKKCVKPSEGPLVAALFGREVWLPPEGTWTGQYFWIHRPAQWGRENPSLPELQRLLDASKHQVDHTVNGVVEWSHLETLCLEDSLRLEFILALLWAHANPNIHPKPGQSFHPEVVAVLAWFGEWRSKDDLVSFLELPCEFRQLPEALLDIVLSYWHPEEKLQRLQPRKKKNPFYCIYR